MLKFKVTFVHQNTEFNDSVEFFADSWVEAARAIEAYPHFVGEAVISICITLIDEAVARSDNFVA